MPAPKARRDNAYRPARSLSSWAALAQGPSIIRAERIRAADQPIDAYTADRWRLDALGLPADHKRAPSLRFDSERAPIPGEFRETIRRAAFLLINEPTPSNIYDRAGSNNARWLGPGAIAQSFRHWAALMRWLHQRGVHALRDADAGTMDDYRRNITGGRHASSYKGATLMSISRLEGLRGLLPADDQLPDLPWSPDDADKFFLKGPRGDNATAVIQPDRMGPLLVWALAWVNDFAPDILAARDATLHLKQVGPQNGSAAGRAVARRWVRTRKPGEVLPGFAAGGLRGFALKYLIGTHQLACSSAELRDALSERPDLVFDIGAPQPLPLPVTGRIAGEAWCTHMDYRDFERTQPLVTHLRTACVIVVAYLTGMRPYEAMNLRRNCHETRLNPSGAIQHLVHGTRYKGLRDDEDMQNLEGSPHTWVTLDLAAKAIDVSHALVDDTEWLWPAAQNRRSREGSGADDPRPPLSPTVANLGIGRFVAWCNAAVDRLKLDPSLAIPDGDPITLSRFRRTLAFHIDDQPDGEIALGLQYGHLGTSSNLVDTSTGGGYAGTQRSGRVGQLRKDQAEGFKKTLLAVQDELRGGGGISGPGAERAMSAASKSFQTFVGAVLSTKEANALLQDPDLQVYDNPFAFSLCVFNQATAACQRGDSRCDSASPVLPECVNGCANRAVLDSGADAMEARARQLARQAETQPHPLAVRLQAKAAAIQVQVQTHRATRRTISGRGRSRQ